jgi:hypothetical protein
MRDDQNARLGELPAVAPEAAPVAAPEVTDSLMLFSCIVVFIR